jgi:GH24 family phage-related lysozyme (muramidase)
VPALGHPVPGVVTLSPEGRRLIISFEGLLKRLPQAGDGVQRYVSYRCPANVATIYAGCTEGVHDGMVVTEAQGEEMFARELQKFERGVAAAVKVPLNQNEFDALVSLAYNIGIAAFRRSTVLKRLNRGDRRGAAEAFGLWNKGGGRVLRGLVSRRKREAALFLKPVEQPAEPFMPQAVTASASPTTKTAVLTASAAGASIIPQLPSPPDLSALSNWSSWGTQLASLWAWAQASPILLAVVGGSVALVWIVPRLWKPET